MSKTPIPEKPILDAFCDREECRGRGFYDKEVYCLNCGWKGVLRQTKGHGTYSICENCPHCECSEIKFR